MATRKVRVGQRFYFVPVLIDRCHPPAGDIKFGDEVIVVRKYGCPPANTIGHCYVNNVLSGKFGGLVHTNSLMKRDEFMQYMKERVAEKEPEFKGLDTTTTGEVFLRR